MVPLFATSYAYIERRPVALKLAAWRPSGSLGSIVPDTAPCVGDVKRVPIRAKRNSVRLLQRIIDEESRACLGIEPITRAGKLWRCVGERVEPAVIRVSEEDVLTCRMDGEVVYCVEVEAEVIIQENLSLVRGGIERAQGYTLLGAADTIVAAGGSEEDQAVSEGSAVGSIDRWTGGEVGQCWLLLVHVDDQWWKEARRRNKSGLKSLFCTGAHAGASWTAPETSKTYS